MGEITEKADTPAKKPSKSEAAELRLQEIEAKLANVEKKQQVIRDGFEFAGNELRPLYGFGAVALVFDAICKKLSE